MQVTRRALGKTGLQVSEIGFGAWQLGGDLWGPVDEGEGVRALRRAVDLGINFFDTAAVYGDGRSEKLVGRALREAGEAGREAIILTKVPSTSKKWPPDPGTPADEAFPVKHLRESVERSLKNLGRERVDVVLLHVWLDSWTEEGGWHAALEALKAEGKIRHHGISVNTFRSETVVSAVRKKRTEVVEVVHNIFEQAPEDALFPAAIEAGCGIISRVPLDESSLGGALTATTVFRRGEFRERYFAGDRLERTVDRVEKLRWLVPKHAPTLADAALRFCLAHEAVSTVIPGMRSVAHVEANAAASARGPLEPPVVKRLRDHRWDRTPEW